MRIRRREKIEDKKEERKEAERGTPHRRYPTFPLFKNPKRKEVEASRCCLIILNLTSASSATAICFVLPPG